MGYCYRCRVLKGRETETPIIHEELIGDYY